MMGGFKASGDLAFLNDWQYLLGAELLTPFGRKQNFDLGISFRFVAFSTAACMTEKLNCAKARSTATS